MVKRYNFKEVKEIIEKQDSILLSEEYINTVTPLNIKCKCGDIFTKKLKVMNKSGWYICNKCILETQTEKQKIKFEDVKKRVEDGGDILITKKRRVYQHSTQIKNTMSRRSYL